MNQYHKIMERFWLIVAIVSFVYAVYMMGKIQDIGESVIYLLFPLVAGLLFYMRYYTRKRYERERGNDQ